MQTTSTQNMEADARYIAALLRKQRVLYSPLISANRLYDLSLLQEMASKPGKCPTAFFDQKSVGALISLMQGHRADGGQPDAVSYRTAAAAMAYFQMAGIKIESDTWRSQFVATKGRNIAAVEIDQFRMAQRRSFTEWAQIAVGNHQHLNPGSNENVSRSDNAAIASFENRFAQSLGYWNMYYVFALKLLELHRQNDMPLISKIKSFFNWQLKEALFSAIASVFAFYLFSNGQTDRSFLPADTDDASLTRQNIENEIRDMLFLQNFKNRLSDTRGIWILTTVDQSLHDIATIVFSSVDREGILKKCLLSLYSESESTAVITEFLALEQRAALPIDRSLHAKIFFKNLESTRRLLENRLGL